MTYAKSTTLLFTLLFSSVLAIGACSTTSKTAQSESAEPTESAGQKFKALPEFAESEQIPVGESPIYGNPNAPITIVTFSSLQCPFSARLATVLRELVAMHPDEVRVVFKHFPLPFQAQSQQAAEALVAAKNQGKFWEMEALLRANIDRFAEGDFEALALELADQLALDKERFLSDVQSPETSAIVDADQTLGTSLGVRGTPSSFVNGTNLQGAQPLEKFVSVIEDERALLTDLKGRGVPPEYVYARAVIENLDRPEPEPEAAPARPQNPLVAAIELRDTDPAMGASAEDALVTIVEFASFQCPFCARGARVMDELLETYPGQIRLVFKHFPLPFQEESEPAARASVAAQNQGKFWEYHDLLFEHQRRLKEEGIFEELAEMASLNLETFRQDFASDETRQRVEQSRSDSHPAEVRGTPAFTINGIRVVGAQPAEHFKPIIEEQIERAQALRDEGLTGQLLYETIVTTNRKERPSQPEPDAAPTPQPREAPPIEDAARNLEVLKVGASPQWGPEDAPVTIYEFSSFQCPFCARGSETLQKIKAEYGDQVRIVYKNFPLPMHRNAEPAALAAIAAQEQGKFWEMYHAIYRHQRELSEPNRLREMAEDIGLDLEQFDADIEDSDLEERMIRDMVMGQRLGVRGTPHYFINGNTLNGAQPLDRFKEIIDREISE